MLADLDLLLTAVFCTADDLLPEEQKNARRSLTDAEVATLCVAQAVMGISSDREFLAVAERRLGGRMRGHEAGPLLAGRGAHQIRRDLLPRRPGEPDGRSHPAIDGRALDV